MRSMQSLIATLASLILTGCAVLQLVTDVGAPLPPMTCSPEEVAALPPGALVQIGRNSSDNAMQSTVGTVLQASPDGVALINCRVEGRSNSATPVVNRLPGVGKQFKNAGVGRTRTPVLWVSRDEMMAVRIVRPAPADYVAPDVPLDMTSGVEEFERVGVDWLDAQSGQCGAFVPPEKADALAR